MERAYVKATTSKENIYERNNKWKSDKVSELAFE
jgi:hypothetical protein